MWLSSGMDEKYTIGQIAESAGVPRSTIRFYERRGLLTPSARSRSNYRLYSGEDLGRLKLIQAAQSAGFTLSNIVSLLDLLHTSNEPGPQVQEIIRTRIEAVDEKIQKLEGFRRTLKDRLKLCSTSHKAGSCGVLKQLASHEKIQPDSQVCD